MACKVSLKLLQESPYQLHFVDEMRMEYGIMVRLIHHPDFKEGEDYYPDQSDNFFVGNSFPTCGINFSAQEIMGQTEANK